MPYYYPYSLYYPYFYYFPYSLPIIISFFIDKKIVPVTVILSPLFSLFDKYILPPPTLVLLTPFYYLPR